MKKDRRGWWVTIGLVGALACIVARLFMIQVISTHSFSGIDLSLLAEESQTNEIILDSSRGEFLDRNGKPLLGEKNWHVLISPQTEQQILFRRNAFKKLAQLTGYTLDGLTKQITRFQTPFILPAADDQELVITPARKEEIERLHIPGVTVVQSDNRMKMYEIAQQVLGELTRNPFLIKERFGDQVENGEISLKSQMGISGLEQTFESLLHGEHDDILLYTKTADGRTLDGLPIHIDQQTNGNTKPPYTVVTTLNRDIQSKVEQILREEGVVDGAVVVQQIATGDVLAMASRPTRLSVTDDTQNPWINRAILQTTPGSIFKTVVAIAAINEGIVRPNTMFYDPGEDKKLKIKDDRPAGNPNWHGFGRISFASAYAKSSNVVFGEVAVRLGRAKLEAYAQQLGLGGQIIWAGQPEQVGAAEQGPHTGSVADEGDWVKSALGDDFHQLLGEDPGSIFPPTTGKQKLTPGVIAQTGIGQNSVTVTPLQMANLVTALFHKGQAISPRLVTEVRDADGNPIFTFQNHYLPNDHPIPIKESTLQAVQAMMRKVVMEGTAQSLATATWQLAGKTGTAQLNSGVLTEGTMSMIEASHEALIEHRAIDAKQVNLLTEGNVGITGKLYNKWMIGYGSVQNPTYSVAVVLRSVSDPNTRVAKIVFRRIMDMLAEMAVTAPPSTGKTNTPSTKK